MPLFLLFSTVVALLLPSMSVYEGLELCLSHSLNPIRSMAAAGALAYIRDGTLSAVLFYTNDDEDGWTHIEHMAHDDTLMHGAWADLRFDVYSRDPPTRVSFDHEDDWKSFFGEMSDHAWENEA